MVEVYSELAATGQVVPPVRNAHETLQLIVDEPSEELVAVPKI